MMPSKELLPVLSSLYNVPLYSPKETLTSDCKNGCLGKPPIFSLRTRNTWQQPAPLLLTSRCFHGNCHCRDGCLRQVLNNERKVKNFEKISFCVFQDDCLFRYFHTIRISLKGMKTRRNMRIFCVSFIWCLDIWVHFNSQKKREKQEFGRQRFPLNKALTGLAHHPVAPYS